MRRRARATALAVAAASFVACGGDDEDPEGLRPVVGEIAPAIAALEEELGGPQQYLEVNATPQFVNLFVAVGGGPDVEAYLYVDGALGPSRPSGQSDAATFAASDLDFDADQVLGQVDEELAESDIVVFSAIEGPAGAMEYVATVESEEGGILDITLAPDGETLSVDPRVTGPGAGSGIATTAPTTATPTTG